jgi:ABC-type uncharacterized transport system permease subunit
VGRLKVSCLPNTHYSTPGLGEKAWWLQQIKRGTNLLGTVVVLKGLAEFAGLLLVGQGLVYVLSFGKHEVNAVYRMFRLLTSPIVRAARVITPNKVSDRHVPFVALMLLFWIWLFLSYTKFSMMLEQAA